MVTTDLPAGPLRSCPVRLGRAFSERARKDRDRSREKDAIRAQSSSPPRTNQRRINDERYSGRRARLGLADRG